MGTSNFHYKHRCVVVTDEDYEYGNYPELGDYRHDALRSYPSYKLDGYDFYFWDIVITSGYYSGACIDCVEKHDDGRNAYDYFSPHHYDSIREFVDDVHKEFKEYISKSRIRKIFSGLKKSGRNILDFIYDKYDEFVKVIEDIERERVNAAIDKIKEDYGYDEYAVSVRFCNGETWYEKVA